VLESEALVVDALNLAPVELDPTLATGTGTWKGSEVRIETHVYGGGPVRFARFARLTGEALDIGNVLCLADPTYAQPILGADLVWLGREEAMLAADLSPTLPRGQQPTEQLAGLAARRASGPALPSGGELPAWCADWFSPHALYTRVPLHQLATATYAYRAFPAAFVELVRRALPDEGQREQTQRAQAQYLAAHRTDDKGLGMLARMFGASWAERYIAEVLFPAPSPAEA
jgi:phycocyanobilin:ferredoxin oxidoreductase